MRGRKRYTREYKIHAVRKLREGKSATSIAKELGIQRTLLYKWNALLADDEQSNIQHAHSAQGEKESSSIDQRNKEIQRYRKEIDDYKQQISALREEIKTLTHERDLLRKAAAYFAREIET